MNNEHEIIEEPAKLDKLLLRQTLLAGREALGQTRRDAADATISAELLAMPEYQEAKTVFCYVSVGAEVDTRAFIRACLSAGKTVCTPCCSCVGQMNAMAITSEADLVEGKYGLLEPCAGLDQVSPSDIDLIVVPCLAATAAGQRIGYGGGYYDRYLAAMKSSNTAAFSVALCRKEYLLASLPLDPHDISVDRVISD